MSEMRGQAKTEAAALAAFERINAEPYYSDDSVTLYHGDSLTVARELASGSVDCIVTSPPYYALRDYGIAGQYGLEESPAAYVETMRALFSELRRVLSTDGTLWLNIGDSYNNTAANQNRTHDGVYDEKKRVHEDALGRRRTLPATGLAAKNLMGIPWQVAFALQDDGWILRNAIIWHKSNAMPESVTDRLSSRYEMVFMFSKAPRYWFDLDSIREPHSPTAIRIAKSAEAAPYQPGKAAQRGHYASTDISGVGAGKRGISEGGRNPGDVWEIATSPFPGLHFAVMPQALAARCIQAGCKPGGTVLDPFSGSGTTGLAAAQHGRKYVGIDLNAEYLDLSLRTRLRQPGFDFEGSGDQCASA